MALEGKKGWFGNVLLAFFAVLVVVLIFEFALRWLEPVSNVQVLRETRTADGPYLALLPGVHGLMLGREVTVNDDGYRGALRPRQKPAGVTRILIFGDSHTFSMGADDEHTYPAVVEQRLNAQKPCCEVLNFGVPGQDLRQYLALLHAGPLDYAPDIVVITFHSGDILESRDDDVPGSHASARGSAQWLYRFKVEALRYSYVARLVIPYGAAFLRGAFESTAGVTYSEQREIESDGPAWRTLGAEVLKLKAELDQRGAQLVFVLFPNMLPFEQHPARGEYAALAAWLEARGIPALNLLPFYDGKPAWKLAASLLDKHPNETGYAIAGDAVAAFLAPRIGRVRVDSPQPASTPGAQDPRSDPVTRASAGAASK